jgi:hypothetical protein
MSEHRIAISPISRTANGGRVKFLAPILGSRLQVEHHWLTSYQKIHLSDNCTSGVSIYFAACNSAIDAHFVHFPDVAGRITY